MGQTKPTDTENVPESKDLDAEQVPEASTPAL